MGRARVLPVLDRTLTASATAVEPSECGGWCGALQKCQKPLTRPSAVERRAVLSCNESLFGQPAETVTSGSPTFRLMTQGGVNSFSGSPYASSVE